ACPEGFASCPRSHPTCRHFRGLSKWVTRNHDRIYINCRSGYEQYTTSISEILRAPIEGLPSFAHRGMVSDAELVKCSLLIPVKINGLGLDVVSVVEAKLTFANNILDKKRRGGAALRSPPSRCEFNGKAVRARDWDADH